MNKKYLSIALLVLIALAFALLFHRGCGSRETQNQEPETVTVTVPAVDAPPVVAPPTVAVPVPEPAPPAMQKELDHYKNRYAHYKALAYNQGLRLAALDSMLNAANLTCEEREALLRQKLAYLDEDVATASDLIEGLNDELAPRRDSGSAETGDYRFRYSIDHFGALLPGGFLYDIDLKPRVVDCPDCPPPPKRALRRNLSGFYGYGLDGRQRYALEARRQWRRVSLSGLVVWDGEASGLVGVGWSW